jgi:hydroxymethylbilane synthase
LNQKKINVLSSSPRREYNLTSFIPVYFPFSCCNVKFHNIRGNVPIRFKKFLDGEGDALVVAKAAIDRLITNPFSEFQDLSKQIKSYISKCLWMILPLSHNPTAPGQGALGLEIRKNDKTLNKAILSITEPLDMKCVDWERQVLKKYNGGCHQKIGVSFFPTHHGIINSKKGETDENKPFYEWGFHRTNNIKHPRVKISEIFPNDLEKYKFFYREEISENVNKVNQIVNHCIWVSRKSAIPKKVKLSSTNVVWTSGIKTWKSLAKRGIWVNGTADGIGEDMSPNILSLARLPWIKLTHEAAPKTAIKNTLSTYRLKELPISFNLKNKKYFYWMSFSAFNLASKREPTILDANHACGPGNTYNEIKKMIKDPTKLDIYLSYEDWKRSIIDGP